MNNLLTIDIRAAKRIACIVLAALLFVAGLPLLNHSASAAQTAASPFRSNGKQQCYIEDDQNVIPGVPPTPANPAGVPESYRWGPFNIDPAAQRGKYELTFVVEDITIGSPSNGTQWSEDPEFDVES